MERLPISWYVERLGGGGIHTPPPKISRSTSATDLKFGPMVHLHKRAKMPPVLIRPPACDVFYRPETKKANLGIVIDLTDQCWSKWIKMTSFIIFHRIWPKKMVLGPFCVIYRPVCKLQILQFCISRTSDAIDLKFWPVVGIDNIRLCAKFDFGHLSGWYFTDRSVNSFCLVARVPFWVI